MAKNTFEISWFFKHTQDYTIYSKIEENYVTESLLSFATSTDHLQKFTLQIYESQNKFYAFQFEFCYLNIQVEKNIFAIYVTHYFNICVVSYNYFYSFLSEFVKWNLFAGFSKYNFYQGNYVTFKIIMSLIMRAKYYLKGRTVFNNVLISWKLYFSIIILKNANYLYNNWKKYFKNESIFNSIFQFNWNILIEYF